jgi:hypothetical protein
VVDDVKTGTSFSFLRIKINAGDLDIKAAKGEGDKVGDKLGDKVGDNLGDKAGDNFFLRR